MVYERKISTEEVANIIILRKAYEKSNMSRFSFWDDRGINMQHVKTIGTKGPVALVRLVNALQKIETRYALHPDDRIKEIFGDGGAEFHLNNINGWHP